MKTNKTQLNKIIIAREILVLFGTIGLGLIVIIVLSLFNGVQNLRESTAWYQVERIDEKINALKEERNTNSVKNLFTNLNEEHLLYEERQKLTSKIITKNYTIFTIENAKNIVIQSMLIYVILFYPVRFAYLAISWSFGVLKEHAVTNEDKT